MNEFVFFTILLSALLIMISAIDIRQLRIPDGLNVLLFGSGISYWTVHSFENLPYQVANAAVVAGLLWLLRYGYAHYSGRIGLGLGDVKMMGAAAVWISPLSVPLLIFIASFSGLVFAIAGGNHKVGARIPFGPFLAVGLISTWLMENLP
jgi:leader peptidase (prepilin peptidase) / N-methyltransferase